MIHSFDMSRCGLFFVLFHVNIFVVADGVYLIVRYVLLKERNMLLTMEHECNEEVEIFPNPERIDKVSFSFACILFMFP